MALEFTFYKCNIFCGKATLENLATESPVYKNRDAVTEAYTQPYLRSTPTFALEPKICYVFVTTFLTLIVPCVRMRETTNRGEKSG